MLVIHNQKPYDKYMNEGFKIEAGPDGEITMPGELVPHGEQLFAPLSPEEEAKFDAESKAVTEASRPQHGDSDLRFGQ
ncbi:MAG: hypothetical protein JWS12_505 [Candidatus Saccharibacteria bacterium]|nr:hypothetical protein [Candidatus Saccharibacteria bacterium]